MQLFEFVALKGMFACMLETSKDSCERIFPARINLPLFYCFPVDRTEHAHIIGNRIHGLAAAFQVALKFLYKAGIDVFEGEIPTLIEADKHTPGCAVGTGCTFLTRTW